MYKDITIVVPTIGFTDYLDQCISEIKKISKYIKIIIIADKNINKKQIINNSNTHLIVTKKKFTISKKRNIGVSYAKTKYIGFIDSDAYPDKNWIKTAIKILENKKEIYLVGGPNISPPNQSIGKKIISEVQKSFLISGKWNFQKMLSSSRYSENLYSCNMIMKKKYYLKVGGMNEGLIAGEDYDFCEKIRNLGKKIYFNSKTIVYHHDRSVKNFLIQKIMRGYTIVDQIKKKSLVYLKNKSQFFFYQLIPLYFFLFVIFSFLNFFLFNLANEINFLIKVIFCLYLITLIVSVKFSLKNFLILPLVITLIFVGNFLIGFGSFISIFGFNNIINYYKNF